MCDGWGIRGERMKQVIPPPFFGLLCVILGLFVWPLTESIWLTAIWFFSCLAVCIVLDLCNNKKHKDERE